MLYASECWPSRSEDRTHMERNDKAMVRWICGVQAEDHINTASLYEYKVFQTETPSLETAGLDMFTGAHHGLTSNTKLAVISRATSSLCAWNRIERAIRSKHMDWMEGVLGIIPTLKRLSKKGCQHTVGHYPRHTRTKSKKSPENTPKHRWEHSRQKSRRHPSSTWGVLHSQEERDIWAIYVPHGVPRRPSFWWVP